MKRILNSLIFRIRQFWARYYGSRPIMVQYNKNFQGEKVDDLRISSSTFIDYPHYLKCHKEAYIGHFNFIEASHGITLGKGVQITNFVTLTTHSSHHSIRFQSIHPPQNILPGYVTGAIEIGDFTFVGPYALVGPGTTIGKGCIVKAHSVLKGKYPDFSIIAGNPAVVVGSVEERDRKFLEKNQSDVTYVFD